MTINGEKVYVDVVKNNHNNQAPTIVHKIKAATDYYYFSIKEALDASTENDVLTLKHDYPLPSGEKAVSTKNITFDMNGHTVTSDGGGVLEINSGLLSILCIYRMNGQLIHKQKLSGSMVVTSLEEGLYIASLEENGKVVRIKIRIDR